MIRIANDFLEAKINQFGAELTALSVIGGDNVLWEKNTIHWNRVAPNLFPIVGRLLNDSYHVNGTAYTMHQHGFARDHSFDILEQSSDSVKLILRANDSTFEKYPFSFDFIVEYTLCDLEIQVRYTTNNTGLERMPYSVGGHPGFALNSSLDEYRLVFPNSFQTERCLLEGSYFSGEIDALEINEKLDLHDELFNRDALVLKNPPFNSVILEHQTRGKILQVSSNNWEAIGFWTKKGAPFLCIEPWWGWADEVNALGILTEKAGIHLLDAGATETVSFSILLYQH